MRWGNKLLASLLLALYEYARHERHASGQEDASPVRHFGCPMVLRNATLVKAAMVWFHDGCHDHRGDGTRILKMTTVITTIVTNMLGMAIMMTTTIVTNMLAMAIITTTMIMAMMQDHTINSHHNNGVRDSYKKTHRAIAIMTSIMTMNYVTVLMTTIDHDFQYNHHGE